MADLGGVPVAVIVGRSGSLYVTQNGGKVGPWQAPVQVRPSIQRIGPDGHVEEFVSEVAGVKLQAPNDLVFGRDGLLYFTDSAEGYRPDSPSGEGRIFAVDGSGRGHVIAEAGPSFPNGIAAAGDGSILWTESYTRAVRSYRDGSIRTIAYVPEASVPDGLKIGRDGNLYITGTRSGGLDVISGDGRHLGFVPCGDVPTNCLFVGRTLYVTDAGDTGLSADPTLGAGALWAIDVGVPGAEPFPQAV